MSFSKADEDKNVVGFYPSQRIVLCLLFICFIFTLDSVLSLFFFSNTSILHIVWSSAWITCVSTGVGALPFLFVEKLDLSVVNFSNAIAAGMMGAASYQLLCEGFIDDNCLQSLLIGALVGVFGMVATEKMEFDFADEVINVSPNDIKRILLILVALTVHSFAEGVGLGVSFHSASLGNYISATLAIHNIPEGLALSMALVPSNISKSTLLLLCIFSSLPQPLMAVPAFTCAQFFSGVLSYGLGFAAGAMLYVSIFELYLSSLREIGILRATTTTFISSVFMLYLQSLF